jgi:hypothetical protein
MFTYHITITSKQLLSCLNFKFHHIHIKMTHKSMNLWYPYGVHRFHYHLVICKLNKCTHGNFYFANILLCCKFYYFNAPYLNTRLIGQVLAHATTFTIVLNHALIYWHNYEYGKYFFASSSFMLGQFFLMIQMTIKPNNCSH